MAFATVEKCPASPTVQNRPVLSVFPCPVNEDTTSAGSAASAPNTETSQGDGQVCWVVCRMTNLRKTRAIVAITFGLGTLALVSPATADPGVHVYRGADADYSVVGTDGRTYKVHVRVRSESVAGRDDLQVRIASCRANRCTSKPVLLTRTLGPGEFEIDAEIRNATLVTRIGGHELKMSWRAPPTSLDSGGPTWIIFGEEPPQAGVARDRGDHVAVGGFAGSKCRASEASTYLHTRVWGGLGGPPDDQPGQVPAGLLPRGRSQPRCDKS